jgi:hypothetical protein
MKPQESRCIYVAGLEKNALKVSKRLRERDYFGGHRIVSENLKDLHNSS